MADTEETRAEDLYFDFFTEQDEQQGQLTTGEPAPIAEWVEPPRLSPVVTDPVTLALVDLQSAIDLRPPTPPQDPPGPPALIPEQVRNNFGTLRPRTRTRGSDLFNQLKNKDLLRFPDNLSGVSLDLKRWTEDKLPMFDGYVQLSISVPEGSDPVELIRDSSDDQDSDVRIPLKLSLWKEQGQVRGVRGRLDEQRLERTSRLEIAPRSCDRQPNTVWLSVCSFPPLDIGTVILYPRQGKPQSRK